MRLHPPRLLLRAGTPQHVTPAGAGDQGAEVPSTGHGDIRGKHVAHKDEHRDLPAPDRDPAAVPVHHLRQHGHHHGLESGALLLGRVPVQPGAGAVGLPDAQGPGGALRLCRVRYHGRLRPQRHEHHLRLALRPAPHPDDLARQDDYRGEDHRVPGSWSGYLRQYRDPRPYQVPD